MEEINRTLFFEQFSKIQELNPLIFDFVEENNIGDNVALFYFASLIKETLKAINDKQLSEAVITYIFDDGGEDEEI